MYSKKAHLGKKGPDHFKKVRIRAKKVLIMGQNGSDFGQKRFGLGHKKFGSGQKSPDPVNMVPIRPERSGLGQYGTDLAKKVRICI